MIYLKELPELQELGNHSDEDIPENIDEEPVNNNVFDSNIPLPPPENPMEIFLAVSNLLRVMSFL